MELNILSIMLSFGHSAFLLLGNEFYERLKDIWWGGTAGDIDGDLITNESKLALKGTRGNPVTKTYALRTLGTSNPTYVVRGYLKGPNKEWFSVSVYGKAWRQRMDVPYIGGSNILFFR